MHGISLRTKSVAKRRGVAAGSAALAAAAMTMVQVPALAQTVSIPPPTFVDVAAVVRCLTGKGCARQPAGIESAPSRSTCVADETLKAASEQWRAKIRAFAKSGPAIRCAAARKAIAPLGKTIRAAYEQGFGDVLTPEEAAVARNFVDACLEPKLLSNAGALSRKEEAYLRQVTGLIVERNPRWGGPRPICTAVAIGQFIITARSCLPADATAQTERGAYLENIAFRFFNSPTLYGLSLRQFGSRTGAVSDPQQDFAILQTVAAPEMRSVEGAVPRLGTMQPDKDLFALTTNVFLRIAAGLRSSTKFELPQATRVYHNVLCRPAYIAPDGLFLHACQMESVVTRGAPLFQRQNGQLVFVGIHSGTTRSLADRSLASCAPGLPNYGIAIPPSVIVRAIVK